MQREQRIVLAFIACLLAVAAVGGLGLFLPWARQAAVAPQPAATAAAEPSIVGRWESVTETTVTEPEREFRVRRDGVVTYGRQREAIEVSRYLFNADGTGTGFANVSGLGGTDWPFTWTLRGDTLAMRDTSPPRTDGITVTGMRDTETHRIRIDGDRMTWLPNGPTFLRRAIPIASQGR